MIIYMLFFIFASIFCFMFFFRVETMSYSVYGPKNFQKKGPNM